MIAHLNNGTPRREQWQPKFIIKAAFHDPDILSDKPAF
jgi:hypothetical protein